MNAKPDPVAEFFAEYSGAVLDLARRLRDVVRSVLPGAREELDQPGGVIGYGFGPGYSGLVCTLILSKKGVKLGIVRGAQLQDPHGLLEGAGKLHRYVAFAKPSDLERIGLRELLQSALAAWQERARAAP